MSEQNQKKDEEKRWLDDPANVKRLIRWFFISCIFMAVLDLVFIFHLHHKHVEFSFEGFPFFYCFYGLGACALLVLVAKQLRKILMRDGDYYDH